MDPGFEFGFVVFYLSGCLCVDVETKTAGRGVA